MSLRSTIAAALRVADRVAGETIFYQRPGNERVPIERVRRGQTRPEVIVGDVTLRARQQDFLIEVSRFTIPGHERPTPEIGDLIVIDDNGRQQIYEVRPFAGQDPYQFHDPHGQWFRIHTQALATEQA